MEPLKFLAAAAEDWPVYIMLLMVSLPLHWLALKKITYGFFDPLFFVVFGAAFGWSVVGLMWYRGDILWFQALMFALCEICFMLGLSLVFAPRVSETRTANTRRGQSIAGTVLLVAGSVHLWSTLVSWGISGIPLFQVSRLGSYVESGGLGLIERLSDLGGVFALYAALYIVISKIRGGWQGRTWAWCFVAWYIVSSIFSGSKSALVLVGNCAFAVAYVFGDVRRDPKQFWGGRLGLRFVVITVLFAMMVLAIQGEADLVASLGALAFRLASYGDIYVFAYPGGTLSVLDGGNPLVAMFGGFLSTFRLLPVEYIYTNLGLQLQGVIFPGLDYIAGPNPRHPVFAETYFGVAAPLFSFVLGIFTRSIQGLVFRAKSADFLSGLTAYVLYTIFAAISVDFDYAMSRFASAIIVAGILLVPVLLVGGSGLRLSPKGLRC